jgi:formylglycine-generating enzyme required for sulfatase activity
MGSPEDEAGRASGETQHRVTLTRPFWIGRYPATQAEYAAVMGKNPSIFKGERRPVEGVSWEDAMEFCRRLTERAREAGCLPEDFGFRLPTEAEWEYACRAGTESDFNDGSECTQPSGEEPALDRLGWYYKNSKDQTHPVGEKLANAWGLHDMHGQVWEWCWDGKREYTTQAQTDPLGPDDPGARRVVRGGGSWNIARPCRSACRDAFVPGSRFRDLGFRLAAGQELQDAERPSGGRRGAPVPEAPAARSVSCPTRSIATTRAAADASASSTTAGLT